MTDQTKRNEADLLVFISSRISEELTCARKTASDAIESLDCARAWMFEHSTASSEAPEHTYLRKVRESDFVVWLVGSETTRPVIDEVNTAISSNLPLLAFRLAADHRDEPTERLIDHVGKYAKWTDVACLEELSTAIKTCLADELIRAVRNPEPPARRKRLSQDYRLSISRCKNAWQSLGVAEDIAQDLAEDEQVGNVVAIPSDGVTFVVGDQGSGKSLAVERIFQHAITLAAQNSTSPHPLFVRARDLDSSVHEHIEDCLAGYADRFDPSVLLVVDGIDEPGPQRGSAIAQQLNIYVDANPGATVIATARPLPGLRLFGELISLDELDEDESMSLIAKISGKPLTAAQFHGWSKSVREAVRLPLFAVMTGSLILQDSSLTLGSQGKLIEQLVREALAKAEGNSAHLDYLLQTLAVSSIDTGSSVHLSSVTLKYNEQQQILSSRLVEQSDDYIDFALPIIREWYAARALLEETISVESFRPRSDRWIPSLSVVLNSHDDDLRHSLMDNLISSEPSLASLLLKHHSWPIDDPKDSSWHLDSAKDAGARLRQTMNLWRTGLGDIFRIIGPVDKRGDIATIAVEYSDQYLTTAWHAGDARLPPIVELDDIMLPVRPSPDWPTVRLLSMKHELRDQFWWAYLQTHRELTDSLSKVLRAHMLALCSHKARHELSWRFLFDVLGRNQLTHTSFPLNEAISATHAFLRADQSARDRTIVTSQSGCRYSSSILETIMRFLIQMKHQCQSDIADPWPTGDLPKFIGRYVWGNYSDQRLLERTNAVYSAAIRIYSDIIEEWLSCFADRLRLYRLLPMRFEGQLSRTTGNGDDWPVLEWHGSILPEGRDSEVAFELKPDGESQFDRQSLFEQEHESFATHRRHLPGEFSMSWISTSLSDVFDADPATKLAHEWLHQDLNELGWRLGF